MSIQEEKALNQGYPEPGHDMSPSHRYEFCGKCGEDIQNKAQWYVHEFKGMVCKECYLEHLEKEDVK